MDESKIGLTERLRREGRWSDASLFKDGTLRKLRSDGMTRDKAGEQAWAAMATTYPPLAAVEESAPEAPDTATGNPRGHDGNDDDLIDVDALLDRIGDGQPSDLVRDTLWVYENLANRKIKASNAPSCGAWALLEWARQYRNRFFEQVLPRAMLNRPPEIEERDREEKRRLEDIRALIRQFVDKAKEEAKALREGGL